MTNTYWNAEVYERIGKPMRRWAQAVIADLDLRGDETVLDAGCGSGSVTFDLLEHLPNGKIYALDASQEMVDSLAKQLDERGETRVIPMRASLTDFTLPEQVDRRLLERRLPLDTGRRGAVLVAVRAAKPGGKLRAQCGGFGNNANVLEATEADSTERALQVTPRRLSRLEEVPDAGAGEDRARGAPDGWTCARTCSSSRCRSMTPRKARCTCARSCFATTSPACPKQDGIAYSRAVVAETIRRYGAPYTADYVRLDLWATKPA